MVPIAKKSSFSGRISDIDLRLLGVFRAVVETGGFIGAELLLNKSKPAISIDIADLEHRLQVTLCKRGRGGFSLTEQGKIVYAASLQLFQDLEKFRNEVSLATSRLVGRVTIHAADGVLSLAGRELVAALARFSADHPEIAIDFRADTPQAVEKALLDGRADLGISALPRPHRTLHSVPLASEWVRLYCGRGHPLFAVPDAKISLAMVQQHRLIAVDVVEDSRLADIQRRLVFSATASTLETRMILLLTGRYLGFMPSHYVERQVERGELRAVAPELFATNNVAYLLLRKDAPVRPAVEELRKLLIAAFAPRMAARRPERTRLRVPRGPAKADVA